MDRTPLQLVIAAKLLLAAVFWASAAGAGDIGNALSYCAALADDTDRLHCYDRLKSGRLALNHQSNGRTEPLSRSWNRLIGQFQVQHDNLGLGLRIWKRFREDAENDDNPDITEYLGHGKLFAGYDRGRHRFGMMLRNPIKHAGVQLDWSYLLNERVRFYVQYFNGYGESLIDYDRQVNRIGAGFLLNEWP